MKREYIQPETEMVRCSLANVIAASPNGTEWHMGDDQSGNDQTIGGGGTGGGGSDNPNEDAKQINLWDAWE